MKKPNFIIAGFPKCGTTSLYHYLSEHPEVYMPSQKELHFFSNNILSKLKNGPRDKVVKKTQISTSEKYLNFYKNVKDQSAIGDASPSYINYPEALLKIKNYLNDPKLIIVLRDPINRAYSNYQHLKREQRESLSFIEALKNEEERKRLKYSDFWYYKFNSTYSYKIEQAQKIFSHVLILTLEELSAKPEETMKKVYKYLDVETNFRMKNPSNRFNIGGAYKSNYFTKLIFQPSTFKNKIKKIIRPNSGTKILLMKLSNLFKSDSEKIDDESVRYLKDFFRDDVNKLKSMKIDISKWRKY